MSDWIHVADALPEMLLAGTYKDIDGTEIDCFESRPVLAYNGAYHVVRRNKSAEEDRFYWSYDGGDVDGITHWMSLPEPPEEP